MSNPRAAFDWIMKLEGGGVLHRVPGDPGGTTKWGFSQRAHPDVDIANLDRAAAFALFVEHYWRRLRCHRIESQEIAEELAEFAFNAGFVPSVRAAQKAVNDVARASDLELVHVDGVMGPETLSGLNAVGERGRLAVLGWDGRFNLYQLKHYRELRPELVARFLAGWTRRVI